VTIGDFGLDHQKLFDISSKSSGQCWSMTNYCPVPGPVPTSPANRDYQAGFTAAMMLKDLGVRFVILGHSERRRVFGETDELIGEKAKAAIGAGLNPIIAVGEEARESEEVIPQTISRQLTKAIHGIARSRASKITIAYEPVWAISTTPGSRPDTPDNATRRAIYIRKLLTRALGGRTADAIRIIYGGSVSAKNAASFIARDIRGMEGLLVGGASLRPQEFGTIVASVAGEKRRG